MQGFVDFVLRDRVIVNAVLIWQTLSIRQRPRRRLTLVGSISETSVSDVSTQVPLDSLYYVTNQRWVEMDADYI